MFRSQTNSNQPQYTFRRERSLEDINKDIETKRFIFKSDDKYDESTQEKYLLGIDSMSENARRILLANS